MNPLEIVRFAFVAVFIFVWARWLKRHREVLDMINPRLAWRSARRMRPREWGRFVGWSAVFVAIALLVIPLAAGFTMLVTGTPLTRDEEHPVTVIASASLPIAFVLLGTLPIFEEWIFRGILLGRLRRRIPALNALIISSVTFGLWHLTNSGTFFWAFIPPTVAGFIFGVAYLKGGLKCATLSHSSYNGIALVIAFL